MKKIIFIALLAFPFSIKAQLADSSIRLVRMQGAVNFRDIGGYKTTDGKEVKWGIVFRSADISKLTDKDLTTLEEKHIHTVIDLRGRKESQQAPDHLLPGTDYTLCPAGSDSLPDMKKVAELAIKGNFLDKFYGNTQYFGARYKPLFQKLLVLPKGESILYHCTGGRDRTGMATALLLYALGVPMDIIEADFTASNVYLLPANSRLFSNMAQNTEDIEKIRKALELKPGHIRLMFSAIKEKYGTIEAFFEQELGVGQGELKKLKALYTI